MTTQVLQRASVECYDCNGKKHQVRHVDRGTDFPGERTAVYTGRQKVVLPVVDTWELFDLIVKMIETNSEMQAPCPVSDNRHPQR